MDIASLSGHPVDAARTLLGTEIRVDDVLVRIVEVEAYGGPESGPWPDSAAHSYRGRTDRNKVMFGPAGHLYVYLSYGMHYCINVSCGPDGDAAAVLLRAGEVLEGHDTVRARRGPAAKQPVIASGPGNLGQALGISLQHNGTDLLNRRSDVRILTASRTENIDDDGAIESGPRVGVSTSADRPWRFWLPNSPAVSVYRRSPRAAPASQQRG